MQSIVSVHQAPARRLAPGRAQVACSRCSLTDYCLPRQLSRAELERFETIVHRSRPLQPGEHLFRAGDPFRELAAVRAGSFKSYVIDRNGDEQVLGFYLPGEIIGLNSIHAGKHNANVVALSTSSVCSLPFESVSALARSMPELQTELFALMSQIICELEETAGDLSAEERVVRFLLSLSQRFARRGYSESVFNLAMSRRDIARHLRLAAETVSRVFARLQDDGVLGVNRKEVRILHMDAMRQRTAIEEAEAA